VVGEDVATIKYSQESVPEQKSRRNKIKKFNKAKKGRTQVLTQIRPLIM
jgi:hypothetical protein